MPSRKKLLGVGVDVISWSRAERFLAAHAFEYLKRLLAPSEQKDFENSHHPVRSFASYFTAKEAYFKACGTNLLSLGEEEFRQIEIRIEGKRRFRLAANLSEDESSLRGEGRFFETPNGIGAEIQMWRNHGLDLA